MKLTLPFPPGVNTLYGLRAYVQNGKPRAFPYKTSEHRDYSTAVKLAALEAGLKLDSPQFLKPSEVAMVVRLYRPRRAGDIDGPLKTLLDVLQGIVFENDDQVARLEVYRHDDKHRPRVELEVTELAAEQPTQPELFTIPALPTDAGAEHRIGQLLREKREAEPLPQRLRRLAKSSTIGHRSDDEPPF